ncbi:hypothetical protein C8J57DRAFT_1608906 [Mycena rebaudengoi]|nr:hypothetical protein C8J57DRAFT_1608906 [Mycena rebaudengoi]
MPQGDYRDHTRQGPSWLCHQTFHLSTRRLLPLLLLPRPQLLQVIVPNLVGPHGWLIKLICNQLAENVASTSVVTDWYNSLTGVELSPEFESLAVGPVVSTITTHLLPSPTPAQPRYPAPTTAYPTGSRILLAYSTVKGAPRPSVHPLHSTRATRLFNVTSLFRTPLPTPACPNTKEKLRRAHPSRVSHVRGGSACASNSSVKHAAAGGFTARACSRRRRRRGAQRGECLRTFWRVNARTVAAGGGPRIPSAGHASAPRSPPLTVRGRCAPRGDLSLLGGPSIVPLCAFTARCFIYPVDEPAVDALAIMRCGCDARAVRTSLTDAFLCASARSVTKVLRWRGLRVKLAVRDIYGLCGL